jgi:hypothetical protein
MTTRRKSSRLTKLEKAEPEVAEDVAEDEEEEFGTRVDKNGSGRGRKRSIKEEEPDEGNGSDSSITAKESKIKGEAKAGRSKVPKKVRKTEPLNAETTDPSQPSRLVQSAAPAVSAPVVSSSSSVAVAKSSPARKKTGAAPSESRSFKQEPAGAGAGAGAGTTQRPLAPQSQPLVLPTTTSSSATTATQNLPSAVSSSTSTSTSTRNQPTISTTTTANTTATTTSTTAVTKEQGLWEKLETMCAAVANSEASNGHSFQLGGTSNSNNIGSSSNVDLSGTFLHHDPYDFVDFNAAGELVMEVRHPMFPEDFSRAGMKEHPLSWWGILDPVHGEGKYRPVPPPPQMIDHRIHAQAPPGQLQAQLQQQQQQQQQQPPPWPTHGRDHGGRPMENGGMTRGGRADAAGLPRWNGPPPMEQGAPWMGPSGGPRRGSPGMPPNGDAFRGGGGPGMPPSNGGGGPGPGRGRPYAPHSRQHGRR